MCATFGSFFFEHQFQTVDIFNAKIVSLKINLWKSYKVRKFGVNIIEPAIGQIKNVFHVLFEFNPKLVYICNGAASTRQSFISSENGTFGHFEAFNIKCLNFNEFLHQIPRFSFSSAPTLFLSIFFSFLINWLIASNACIFIHFVHVITVYETSRYFYARNYNKHFLILLIFVYLRLATVIFISSYLSCWSSVKMRLYWYYLVEWAEI